MRLLLVEDDAIIGDGIKVGLSVGGFAVDWVTDGQSADEAIDLSQYDAVILDLTLPGLDGLDLLRKWRKKGLDVPILIVTARDALAQRVEGLNLGADDYIGKPFALEELTARLRAIVRRHHGQSGELLTHGDVSFCPGSRKVCVNGEEIPLSPKALALLELFLLNKNKVLAKDFLEEKLYPWGEELSSNALEVHVHHIRRRLGPGFIRTVHGLGYKLGEIKK